MTGFYDNENHDIALTSQKTPSCADPMLVLNIQSYRAGWRDLNI